MSNNLSKVRSLAYQKQKGRCFYCGAPMWKKDIGAFAKKHSISEPSASRFQCTAEHLLARRDGGSDDKDNIVAACLFCNNKRHWRRKNPPPPTKYKSLIQSRIKKGKWHPKEMHHVLV